MQAVETAASLKARYGRDAVQGGKVALQFASSSGDAGAIDLWSEVCAILATDQVVKIR